MDLLDDSGTDPLTSLELRIQKAVDMIPRLRQEKDAAVREKEDAVRAANEALEKLSSMTNELETLRQEKEQVRARIEKLLGHLDAVGTS